MISSNPFFGTYKVSMTTVLIQTILFFRSMDNRPLALGGHVTNASFKQSTLAAGDLSNAVSGFCQVFIVTSRFPKIPAAHQKNLWYPG